MGSLTVSVGKSSSVAYLLLGAVITSNQNLNCYNYNKSNNLGVCHYIHIEDSDQPGYGPVLPESLRVGGVFVFAYAKSRFSHGEAQTTSLTILDEWC